MNNETPKRSALRRLLRLARPAAILASVMAVVLASMLVLVNRYRDTQRDRVLVRVSERIEAATAPDSARPHLPPPVEAIEPAWSEWADAIARRERKMGGRVSGLPELARLTPALLYDAGEDAQRRALAEKARSTDAYARALDAALARIREAEGETSGYRALPPEERPAIGLAIDVLRLRGVDGVARGDAERVTAAFESRTAVLRYLSASCEIEDHAKLSNFVDQYRADLKDTLAWGRLDEGQLIRVGEAVRALPGPEKAATALRVWGRDIVDGTHTGEANKGGFGLTTWPADPMGSGIFPMRAHTSATHMAAQWARHWAEEHVHGATPFPPSYDWLFNDAAPNVYRALNQDAAGEKALLEFSEDLALLAERAGSDEPFAAVKEDFDAISDSLAMPQSAEDSYVMATAVMNGQTIGEILSESPRKELAIRIALERFRVINGEYPEAIGEALDGFLIGFNPEILEEWDYVKQGPQYSLYAPGGAATKWTRFPPDGMRHE